MRPVRRLELINAKTLEEASSTLAKYNGKAWPLAGGTDIVGTLREAILPEDLYPEALVNLKKIEPSLEYIKEEAGVLKIGATTRLEDIANNTVIKSNYAALAQAAGRAASPHIREMGTIGGNLCQLIRCWYFRKEDNRFHCLRKGGSMCYAWAGGQPLSQHLRGSGGMHRRKPERRSTSLSSNERNNNYKQKNNTNRTIVGRQSSKLNNTGDR